MVEPVFEIDTLPQAREIAPNTEYPLLLVEFAIPILKFNPDNVVWGHIKKTQFRRTISIGYENEGIYCSNVIVYFEPMRIIEIDSTKKQLVLEDISVGPEPFSEPVFGIDTLSPANVLHSELAYSGPDQSAELRHTVPLKQSTLGGGSVSIPNTGPDQLSRIEQFQNVVINYMDIHSSQWLSRGEILLDQKPVSISLQPWVKSHRISLYLSERLDDIQFYIDGKREILSNDSIKPGDSIQASVKIHGISLQLSETGTWTGKSRIQHSIVQLRGFINN